MLDMRLTIRTWMHAIGSSMGPGLGFESPEEIQAIEQNAQAAAGNAAAGNAPDGVPANRKRKLKDSLTSDVWNHFKRGDTQEDGSYLATCNYCGKEYPMGRQRSTSSLKHHITKGCKLIPRSRRFKPDALQRMLAAGSSSGIYLPLFCNFFIKLYINKCWH